MREPWPNLRELLERVAVGEITPDEAQDVLRRLPFGDLGFARIDHHRWIRTGLAEAVYGPGKTPDQCAAIIAGFLSSPISSPVVLTRADERQVAAALKSNPGGRVFNSTVVWNAQPCRAAEVVIVSAGTGDLMVAEECQATLTAYGYDPKVITDVGVAGLHRLLVVADQLQDVDAIVVIAGMEGTLPAVIGGLTAAPIIAVPTSVGYGSSLRGHTALLGMLASCAQGITVMGIDNGFGAACAVARLAARIELRAATVDKYMPLDGT
ncbi:nickel pincer cofactor biosynthesis protein LarB [Ferrimicrobium sp.]|nr:nickel pincer cofactor biosynthesis protein LarB [Ferrimicrobium sp.]